MGRWRAAFGRQARPGWRRLSLAALLGAGVAAGQAPLSAWFVALPALSALVWLMAREETPARAAWAGWIGGAGYFAAAMFWIVEPFFVDVARHGWMAPFALVFMAFGMALFWAAAAGLAARAGGAARRAWALALALAFADLARGYVLTGFPWALIGHIWIGAPVMQAAAFVGPVGLSLMTTLAAAAPWLFAAPRARALAAAAAVAALGLVWTGGVVRLAQPMPEPAHEVRVRLIQPNATQHLKWIPEKAREFFDRQLAQTAAPADPPPDLVVWPETAVPWLLNEPGPVLEIIAGAAGGAPVALGIQRTEGMRSYNSLAVIDPAGRPAAVYDKFHLAPFGEYIPLGDLAARFGVSAFAAQAGNAYSAGPGAQVLDLGPLGKVQPLICYEAVFPQDIRAAPERPDWLLQVTNDGWFGDLSGPYQHLAQTRLRAVEQGLPLLRSANTGVSAVIDARGRVLDSVPLNTEGIIDAALPAALPPTLYARTGDWPALFLILAGIVPLLRRRDTETPVDRAARRN